MRKTRMRTRIIGGLLAALLSMGCFIPHAIPYIPPVPINPYPQEMFGHKMLNGFRPAGDQTQSMPLAGKVTLSFTRNQYRYHGTGISLLAHGNSRDLGSIEIRLSGIRKAAVPGGSALIADKVYVRVLRFDGRPFSAGEYKAARFGEDLAYDQKTNMMLAGEGVVFAERNQVSHGDHSNAHQGVSRDEDGMKPVRNGPD